jgi:hypothetical protein
MWYLIAGLFAALWVGLDAYSRRSSVILHSTGAFLFGAIVVPIWIASRPLRQGETREGGRAWNVLRNFAITWTILMTMAGFAGLLAMGRSVSGADSDAARTGAGLGMLMGLGLLGAVWFFPMIGAVVLGSILKKSSENEVGPTGPLSMQGTSPRGFVMTAGSTTGLTLFAVVVAVALSDWRHERNATAAASIAGDETVAPTSNGEPTPRPDPPGSFRDGTLTVGQDLEPGTYRTSQGLLGCYWARLARRRISSG